MNSSPETFNQPVSEVGETNKDKTEAPAELLETTIETKHKQWFKNQLLALVEKYPKTSKAAHVLAALTFGITATNLDFSSTESSIIKIVCGTGLGLSIMSLNKIDDIHNKYEF